MTKKNTANIEKAFREAFKVMSVPAATEATKFFNKEVKKGKSIKGRKK